MSDPSQVSMVYVKTCIRTVTTAGTREQFLDTAGLGPEYYGIMSITIRADADNAGNIYFGGDNRVLQTDFHYILAAGETISLTAGQDALGLDRYLNVGDWHIDSSNDGEGLTYTAISDKRVW